MEKKRFIEYLIAGLVVIGLVVAFAKLANFRPKADEGDNCSLPTENESVYLPGVEQVFASGQDEQTGNICVSVKVNPPENKTITNSRSAAIVNSAKLEEVSTGIYEYKCFDNPHTEDAQYDHVDESGFSVFKVALPVLHEPPLKAYYCVYGSANASTRDDQQYNLKCSAPPPQKVVITRRARNASVKLESNCSYVN